MQEADIYDVSVVTFPALDATWAGLRAMDEALRLADVPVPVAEAAARSALAQVRSGADLRDMRDRLLRGQTVLQSMLTLWVVDDDDQGEPEEGTGDGGDAGTGGDMGGMGMAGGAGGRDGIRTMGVDVARRMAEALALAGR